ncbi:MAG TPA: chorismate mutase [Candidatus Limnocylindrales bacterium]|jgi:chorismate mutase
MADGQRRDRAGRADESPELRRLRRRIDALDRRIVRLLNERAEIARAAGRLKTTNGRRAIRDPQREREILLRVSMANDGPTPQADLLAIYRRLFAVARRLERSDRTRARRAAPFGGVPPAGDER